MSLIDEVKSRSDIVDVVASYVDLDTSSRNPKARCPFHTERTPSFYVFPESETWRCFGACATGGDVLSFVMKQEGIEFKEALHQLADRAGVKYSDSNATVQADIAPKATVIEANEAAARWFAQMMLSSEGVQVREYLASRGIDTDIAARRGMGFAPGDGTLTLAGNLRSSQVTPEAARDARLVVQADDRSWRDFFRNRLMIEIRDRAGKVIGFGARSLDGSEPKYLNTPKTNAFDKSRVLYGIDWAGDSIRQSHRAVVVEGYMDVITAHEHGFTDVVASMGTAVTPDQLKTLSQIVSSGDEAGEVVLCLDSDAAGQDATRTALETLIGTWKKYGGEVSKSKKAVLNVSVAAPVDGKDPDEAIRTDSWAWRRSLENAVPILDYVIKNRVENSGISTGEDRAAIVKILAPLIANVEEDSRYAYWEKLAVSLGVSEERLRWMAHGASAGADVSKSRFRRNVLHEDASSAQDMARALGSVTVGIEEHLLALVLEHPELREFAEAVPTEHFLDTANRELFTQWVRMPTLDEMLNALSSDIAEKAEQLRSVEFPPSDHARRVDEVTQCVRRLRERFMRNLLKLTEIALKEEEGSLEGEEREQLRSRTLDPSDHLKKVFQAGATGRV